MSVIAFILAFPDAQTLMRKSLAADGMMNVATGRESDTAKTHADVLAGRKPARWITKEMNSSSHLSRDTTNRYMTGTIWECMNDN